MTKARFGFIWKHRQNYTSKLKSGKEPMILVWSYILDYENGKNPYEEKRLAIAPWKKISSFCVTEETEDILIFADALAEKGIKTYDALHISCAVAAHCKYYITTDKKLLNTPISEIKIVNPIVFVMKWRNKHENRCRH